jgi:hypothetical protein
MIPRTRAFSLGSAACTTAESVPMMDCELQRRPSACGYTDDEHLLCANAIEELGIRIRLHRDRQPIRQSGAKVAKARWNYESIAARGQRCSHVEALIEAAAGAVHDKHRVAFTHHGVFDGTERGLDHLAAAGEAGSRTCQVARKNRVPIDCKEDQSR